jgi:hypothetical protein
VGQICTFGFGQDGRLGHGDARDQNKPTMIVFDIKIKFVQVAGGAFHSLALTSKKFFLYDITNRICSRSLYHSIKNDLIIGPDFFNDCS